MSITDIDISTLPPPSVIEELSFEAVRAEILAEFVARWPQYDMGNQEDDPVSMLLEACSMRELKLRARMNDVARAEVLTMAQGADLQLIGAFYDVVRLTDESDARLRQRIVLAIAGRSTGGTRERYEYHAMTADVRIAKAVAWTNGIDPVVRISILNSINNGVPYAEMLTAVEEAVNADDVKMVNDTIIVDSAVQQTVNITAEIIMLEGVPQSVYDGLPQALRDAWTLEGGLGRDLTADWIKARLMRSGVYKATPIGFTDTAVEFNRAVVIGTITLVNKGRGY